MLARRLLLLFFVGMHRSVPILKCFSCFVKQNVGSVSVDIRSGIPSLVFGSGEKRRIQPEISGRRPALKLRSTSGESDEFFGLQQNDELSPQVITSERERERRQRSENRCLVPLATQTRIDFQFQYSHNSQQHTERRRGQSFR